MKPRADVDRAPGTRIRAILFDVDGTLYHQGRLRGCMAAELATMPLILGSMARSAQIVRVLRMYRRVHEELRRVSDADSCLAQLQVSVTARREGLSEHEVSSIVSEWMVRRPLKYLRWCRRRGLVALLARFQQRGTRLGVLSDYPSSDKLAALGVDGFFGQVLCTTDRDINALKPNPRGFLLACARWDVPPAEVLYVGDRSDVDAGGAGAAGLRCAVFSSRLDRGDRHSGRPIPIRRLDDLDALVAAF